MAGIKQGLVKTILGLDVSDIGKVIKSFEHDVDSWDSFSSKDQFKNLNPQSKMMVRKWYWEEKIEKSPKYLSFDENQRKEIEDSWSKDTIANLLSDGFEDPQRNSFFVKAMNKGGDIVEAVAQKIEPSQEELVEEKNIPQTISAFGRQNVAEYARFYKPWTILTVGVLGTLAKPVGKKVVVPVSKRAWKALPKGARDKMSNFFLRNMTIGRGTSAAYQSLKGETQLVTAAGKREADKVIKTLSVASKDTVLKSKGKGTILIKKGKPFPQEHQNYLGRLFRKEVDLSGKKSRLLESSEVTKQIQKNVEVEVAFNPKVQQLNVQLASVNKSLKSQRKKAEAKIGQVFEAPQGGIEKVTGIGKAVGKDSKRKTGFDLITETQKAKVKTVPEVFLQEEGQQVFRGQRQVRGMNILTKAEALERKKLLAERKLLSKNLGKEIFKIENKVRDKYAVIDTSFVEKAREKAIFRELESMANEGRTVMDHWSKELIKTGIPKDQALETIESNLGSYMANMYKSKLNKTAPWNIAKAGSLRLRLNGLKRRKDLSSKVMNELGIVKAPAYPTGVRIGEISETVANNKLFATIAANSEWTAVKDLTGNMVKMGDSPMLGALRNKYVTKNIADDINGILIARGASRNIYAKALSAWKYSKVVLNPATHSRNIMSNSMLLDFSGVNHAKQLVLYPRAMKEYMTKGKYYNMALEDGAIGGEFVGSEVARLKHFYESGSGNNTSRLMNMLKAPFKKAGKVYQAEEQIAKLVKYIYEIEKTGSRKFAAKESQKWLFDYNKIPKWMEFAKHGAPFATFTYKAVPRVAETLVNNPMKMYKYYAFFNGWNKASAKMLDMSPEDFAREQGSLPPWLMDSIGGMPSTLLLPYRDKNGDSQWINLEYILPIGMAPEIAQKGLAKGLMGNPFLNIYSDLRHGKDYLGRSIEPPAATAVEKIKATTQTLYRELAPSLAPSLFDVKEGDTIFKGGYSFEKLLSAIYKRPNYADKIKGLTPTLLDVLSGIKITTLDIEEADKWKVYNAEKIFGEIQREAWKVNNNPGLSDKRKEKELDVLFRKQQKIIKDYQKEK